MLFYETIDILKSQHNTDYAERNYMSAVEVSSFTGLNVNEIHALVKKGALPAVKSTSGQYRFSIVDITPFRRIHTSDKNSNMTDKVFEVRNSNTCQTIINCDSRNMEFTVDDSVHLAITSPPYFNAKMYSQSVDDLGNVHDLDTWLCEIEKVWKEVYRVLCPGRKFFLNIMNLPVRINKSFRTLNLCGKNIDVCESIGFIFKRDIVWHKTNGVRAHFGTYPYPGGILLNHMHEFILEFEKPMTRPASKYAHVTDEQREYSKLDKEFWLSIKNSDVWLMKPEKSGINRKHAAPFPAELPSRLIKAYSFAGETVIDPFMGSGTTLSATTELNRNGIGYEINSEFCSIALNTLTNLV